MHGKCFSGKFDEEAQERLLKSTLEECELCYDRKEVSKKNVKQQIGRRRRFLLHGGVTLAHVKQELHAEMSCLNCLRYIP